MIWEEKSASENFRNLMTVQKLSMDKYKVPKVLLLDGDGVIWIDGKPFPKAVQSLQKIKSMGVRLVLVTNNASKTRFQYQEHLHKMGLDCFDQADIFSSGYGTAVYLKSQNLNNVFVIGFDGLREEFRNHGIQVHDITTDPEIIPVQAVIIGKSDTFSFEEINRGIDLVRTYNAKLISTNIDPSFPLAHGVFVPGGGACAKALEEGCGKKVDIIIGKPSKILFDIVLNELNITEDDVIMVGDRIITDIAFASRNNARSILVLSGVDTQKTVDEAAEIDKPTFVLPSLNEIVDLIEKMKK